MKHITLTISDIERLNSIKTQLASKRPLTINEQEYLLKFLSQVPTPEAELLTNVPFAEEIKVHLWDVNKIEDALKQWYDLFNNIPGMDYAPGTYIIDQNDDKNLYLRNVIMTADFAPTLSYNEYADTEPYQVHLKDDGTALFWFPSFEEAEKFPELFNFTGTWREAYLLLVETLKKGWPMEEFPDELKPLLKK